MKIQYILFDIDDTLIDFNKTYRAAARDTLLFGGKESVTEEDVDLFSKENDRIWFGLELDHSERYEICRYYHEGYNTYLHRTAAAAKELFGLLPTVEQLDTYFRTAMGTHAVPSNHIFETLEALSEEYGLCIASNGLTRVQFGKVTKFLPYMKEMFVSEDLDYVKPEKEYFTSIADTLKCPVEEILMVGDSLKNDIGGANNAGMPSCYYNPRGNSNYEGVKPMLEIRDFNELTSRLKQMI